MCNQRLAKRAEGVIEAGRRFLEANERAAIAGGRPTDPDVAFAAGVPVFDAEEALRTALLSRQAREDFHDALASWDNPSGDQS